MKFQTANPILRSYSITLKSRNIPKLTTALYDLVSKMSLFGGKAIRALHGSPCPYYALFASWLSGPFPVLKRQISIKYLFSHISGMPLNTLAKYWTVLNKTQASIRTIVRPSKVKFLGIGLLRYQKFLNLLRPRPCSSTNTTGSNKLILLKELGLGL